jgi:lactate dehydrogenase-like 2-hydroxyacid dehydrogenase
MKPDILLIEPMTPDVEARLDTSYNVHRLSRAKDHTAFLAEVGANIRAIITGGRTGASNAIVDALPKLEIIAINGIGTDAVDLDLSRRRGIHVTTTPDVLTDDVADLAIALLLATARHICVGDRFVRAGKWLRSHLPLATKVSGKRLGIIGLGRVGRAIARRAEGFDLSIVYADPIRKDDVAYRYQPELRSLASEVDFLVVAAAGGPASRNIVGREVIDALGPDGILINVSRGSIVDEEALVAALTEGRLSGAGLDVFAHEPEVPEALWRLDNVVLQPHQASATVETRRAMADLVLANLAAHFAGRKLPSAVV